MKTRPVLWAVLIAAVVGLGVLLAEEEAVVAKPGAAADSAIAEVVQQNKEILDNQKKILDQLDKLAEDVRFVKNKVGGLR